MIYTNVKNAHKLNSRSYFFQHSSDTCDLIKHHAISSMDRNGRTIPSGKGKAWLPTANSSSKNCNIFLRIRLQRMLVGLHATAIWLCCAIGLVAQCKNMISFISWPKVGKGITAPAVQIRCLLLSAPNIGASRLMAWTFHIHCCG